MTDAMGESVTILIAEDDDGHAELVRAQLLDAGIRNAYIRFRDGLELWSSSTYGCPGRTGSRPCGGSSRTRR